MNDRSKRESDEPKITTGPNDRPRNETVGQTGGGVPDDSGTAPEISEEEARKIAEKLRSK